MKWKKMKAFCNVLISAFLLAGALFPALTTQASGNCEEWYARLGLIDKTGDNENGYTIGSRGDSGPSLVRLEEPLDILSTEIRFSFKAYPTDGVSDEVWAYMSFGRDFKDKTLLHSTEENREAGCVELILWQRAGGGFNLSLFNDYENAVIAIDEFDFDAVHTLAFSQKSVGIYLVFDGVPYTTLDFTTALEKHIGENAGSTYLALGGMDGYEFSNLQIIPGENITDGNVPNASAKGSKLGDMDVSDKQAEPAPASSKSFLSPFALALMGGIAAALLLAIGFIFLLARRRKKQAVSPADAPGKP